MNKNFGKSLGRLSGGVILAAFVLSVATGAQDLEKKYAPILGNYEFDMTGFGMGMVTVKVFLENDALWAWPDNSDSPGEMIPVEGQEFVFTVDAGDQGVYKLEFIKDAAGEYTKCHVTNDALGLDMTGEKIKEHPRTE